ncbi:PID domain-containing protein [Trichostrongylus colubriformis]|uniref:PID domain-containing protein n=1 Tax=Trichostrongylus colubriformis TaxID=6319 RepID=A0AAN8IL03_TRICO
MYSKLLSSLLGRHHNKSKSDLSPQCNAHPGPACERTIHNVSHLPTDGGGGGGGGAGGGGDGGNAPVGAARQSTFAPAGHTLFLDDCQLIDHAPCSRCTTNLSDNYEVPDMRQHFALSWNVKYLGSFPISNTTPDHVSSRLENFQVPPTSKSVTLSVSLLGVRIHNKESLLMSHSLRRVCSVIGRPALRQVAYTAMEAAGQTYRRQCHVFQTDAIHQVIDYFTWIESKINYRKRRPVSAVFSSALHRLSSSASVANKRMSSIDSPPRKDIRREELLPKITSPLIEEPVAVKEKKPSEPELVFDEKLGEWIYPVDETLQAQLENVNYFVKLPSRYS